MQNLVNKLMKYDNLKVEVVGTWLWVSGDTKPVKEELKELGFRWHKVKKMWFISEDGKYKRSRKNMEMAEIKAKYGYKTIKEMKEAK